MSKCYGRHLIIDCKNVNYNVCLDDKKALNALKEAAEEAGSTVINANRYRLGHDSPPGFTCVVMLDESHCSMHSYADKGLLAIDIFTCGKTDPWVVFSLLKSKLNLYDSEIKTTLLERFEI